MTFDGVKILITAVNNIANCNVAKDDWEQQIQNLKSFEHQCGLLYYHQEVLHYCYTIIDEHKWLIAKLKYGI